MLKLLHTADIHLDSPLKSLVLRDPDLAEQAATATRVALSRIVNAAIAENVAAVLIAGDLFDGQQRSARTGAFVIAEFDRLRDRAIRVFCIRGNHDAENPISGAIDLPDNVHVFDGRGGRVRLTDDVWIHGVSFAQRRAPESLLPKFGPPVPGAVNIGMLHSSLAGAAGHDVYAPCTPAELAAHGFDYWALGHVHRRQIHATAPWIVMPGTPQGRDMGETGPKSATLITIDGGISVAEVPTSVLEFVAIDLPVPGDDGDDALRDAIRARLRAAAQALQSDFGAVRLTLTGQSPRRWQILRDRDMWAETARGIARETGRLWLEKLVIDIAPGSAAGQGATDELGRIMDLIRAEEGFRADARARLEALLAELPAPRRATLVADEAALAALAARLAAAGAERVLARMKGGSR
ncbi:MAG: DNA repair exonuclease [Alphaproteobacteria bacterium]|nr:MAG: DNA repair exonuclease [Alphaproteobacteria bacterium]